MINLRGVNHSSWNDIWSVPIQSGVYVMNMRWILGLHKGVPHNDHAGGLYIKI